VTTAFGTTNRLCRTNDDADAKEWLAGVFDRAASTYDVLAGSYHDHFGVRLVDLAGVAVGDSVLDVACGRGALLVPAARRVGASGHVVGVDLSPEMVRLARQRVVDAGFVAQVRVMDAENLDMPAESCSVVLCGFGIFFLPDPERAVVGFNRVLSPGGTVGLSTWGVEDERWSWEDELFADVAVERRAVRRSFDRAEDLEQLLRSGGFDEVAVHVEQHEVRLADADEWWAWKWSYSLRGLMEQLPAERIERLRHDAFERIEAMDRGEGLPVRLEALIALGHKPA
jgi:ubiquinone/menaquinone biosynthesis C-methylase UbiE